jgi:hypothetical protein
MFLEKFKGEKNILKMDYMRGTDSKNSFSCLVLTRPRSLVFTILSDPLQGMGALTKPHKNPTHLLLSHENIL